MEKGLERKQCCLLGSCPNHFFHFPYATGAILIAALVLNPRVGGFAYILGWYGPFKWTLLRDWQFLLPPQAPLVFAATRLYFLALAPRAARSGLRLGSLDPQLLSAIRECGTAHSATSLRHFASSLPLRPVWMFLL